MLWLKKANRWTCDWAEWLRLQRVVPGNWEPGEAVRLSVHMFPEARSRWRACYFGGEETTGLQLCSVPVLVYLFLFVTVLSIQN